VLRDGDGKIVTQGALNILMDFYYRRMGERPVCFLDMDGVIANFRQSVGELFRLPLGIILGWESMEICDIIGCTEQELWDKIDGVGPSFWEKIQPYPWVQSLLDSIHKRFGLENTYLLSNPGRSTSSPSGKLAWVKRYMPEVLHDRLITTGHKYMLAGANRTLIDDDEENCETFKAAGGRAVLFPQPWNRMRNVAVEAAILDIGKTKW